jgi:hypothetical protein
MRAARPPRPPRPDGMQGPPREPREGRDLLSLADANKDGRLTREEAAAAARQGREGGPRRGPGRPW